MKTFSAYNIIKTDNPNTDPVNLVKIELDGLTLYLCDRIFGDPGSECEFDGNVYDPLILSIGNIQKGKIDPDKQTAAPGRCRVNVFNNAPIGGAASFTDLFSSYETQYAAVTVSTIFNGTTTAEDKIDRFIGKIENLPDLTRIKVSLDITGFDLDVLNKWDHTIVNATDFPGADPDDIGKMLPQAWGRCKRVPFRAVDAGALTQIIESLTAAATGVKKFTDVSSFPASGTIQIDSEQMTYSAKSDANNTLTISARAAGGTSAEIHNANAAAAEVKSEYFYIMDHAVNSIDFVYVSGIRQDGNFTAYTGQTGDQHATYGARACIKFTTLPIVQRQVNVSVSDTVAYSSSAATKEIYPDDENGSATNPENAYDGSDITYAQLYDAVFPRGQEYTYPSTDYGTVSKIYHYATIAYGFNGTGGSGGYLRIENTEGDTLATYTASVTKTTIRLQDANAGIDWDTGLQFFVDNKNTVLIYEVWKVVEYAPDLLKSGSVSISGNSSADTVIGGPVSVDLKGFQDDGAGTYTGAADAIIERPGHILKHMIIDRCGLTSSQIDSTSYAAADTFYIAGSYRHAVCLTEKPNPRELFAKIAFQARSLEFWEVGVHYLVHMPDAVVTTKTIEANRIDDGIKIQLTPRVNIVNTMSARYNKFWSTKSDIDADRSVVDAVNSSSVTEFGTLESTAMDFDFIIDEAVAQDVLDFLVGIFGFPRKVVNFSGGHYNEDIERGDVLEFSEGIAGDYKNESARILTRGGDYILTRGGHAINWRDTDAVAAQTYLNEALLNLVTLDSDQFRVLDDVRGTDNILLQAIKV